MLKLDFYSKIPGQFKSARIYVSLYLSSWPALLKLYLELLLLKLYLFNTCTVRKQIFLMSAIIMMEKPQSLSAPSIFGLFLSFCPLLSQIQALYWAF